MAQKLLKRKPHKIAHGRARTPDAPQAAGVLVGTYKDRQLAWIKRHGIYNYPVRDGDEFDEKAFASIKELWLYADVKGTRHVFGAEFVGIKTREELIGEYGYPANGVFNAETQRRRGGGAGRPLPAAKPHGSRYYVFKTKYLDYGPRLDDPLVIARTADFGGRSAKVKKAIEQFKADGEFAPLEHYLPSDLAKVPRNRLRVCEAAVQYHFWDMPEHADLKPQVPFPPPEHPKFTFIDLFAGIGGFRLAMQSIGGRCVFTSEWDKNAQKTYLANYGEQPYGDIRQQSTKDCIPKHFDVLCAGFPCQPFSLAGVSARTAAHRAHGFNDEAQGTLFFDVLQIIRQRRPRVVFLENVRNLVNHDEGRTFDVIRRSIEGEGYSFSYKLIDASPLVPQKRVRCYMVCVRDGTQFNFPKIEGAPLPLRAILENHVSDAYTISDNLWAGHQRRTRNNLARGTGFTAFTANLDEPSHTLVARYYKDGKECLVPQEGKNPRLLTPRECARLQGFPESFILPSSRSVAYKQMGNSVAVPVLRRIAECIDDQILKGENHGV